MGIYSDEKGLVWILIEVPGFYDLVIDGAIRWFAGFFFAVQFLPAQSQRPAELSDI